MLHWAEDDYPQALCGDRVGLTSSQRLAGLRAIAASPDEVECPDCVERLFRAAIEGEQP